MLVGCIKKLDTRRGFGFIAPDDEGPDVYFHRSVVAHDGFDRLAEGQEVSYELEAQAEDSPARRRRRAAAVARYFGGQVLAKIGEGSIAPLRRHPRSRGKKPAWRGKQR